MIEMDDAAEVLEWAVEFACRAHRGQRYPSPEPQPYAFHLFRVMLAVDGDCARIAALLHDVLEDTEATMADLRDAVPAAVVDAVIALTHRPQDTYEEYIELVALNPLARMVKLADLADNLSNNRGLPRTVDVVARIARYEHAMQRLVTPERYAR